MSSIALIPRVLSAVVRSRFIPFGANSVDDLKAFNEIRPSLRQETPSIGRYSTRLTSDDLLELFAHMPAVLGCADRRRLWEMHRQDRVCPQRCEAGNGLRAQSSTCTPISKTRSAGR